MRIQSDNVLEYLVPRGIPPPQSLPNHTETGEIDYRRNPFSNLDFSDGDIIVINLPVGQSFTVFNTRSGSGSKLWINGNLYYLPSAFTGRMTFTGTRLLW